MAMDPADQADVADLTRLFSTAIELKAAVYRAASRSDLDAIRAKAASILEGYLDRQEEVATRRIREG